MAMADVTVMGAGIFGLSIAWACQRRGAKVQVIDPAGVGAGASGGVVGALAPHVPEQWNAKKAFQLESLLMAEGFWRAVQDAGGGDAGYRRTGRLQPLADAAAVALAQERATGAEKLWRDAARWDVTNAPDGWAPDSPTGLVVRDTLSAHVHPAQAVRALAQALDQPVTADGAEEGRVIWATGWQGLDEMSGRHHRMIGAGIKGQAAVLDYRAGDVPQIFAGGVHIIPHANGTVAVGSTTERTFDSAETTDAQLDDVIARACAAVPALQNAPVVARWAGVRPRARSRAPMLGAHPHRKGAFVANGGFKIGFGMAPKVADVMADLVLEGRDTIPDGFRTEDNL